MIAFSGVIYCLMLKHGASGAFRPYTYLWVKGDVFVPGLAAGDVHRPGIAKGEVYIQGTGKGEGTS